MTPAPTADKPRATPPLLRRPRALETISLHARATGGLVLGVRPTTERQHLERGRTEGGSVTHRIPAWDYINYVAVVTGPGECHGDETTLFSPLIKILPSKQ